MSFLALLLSTSLAHASLTSLIDRTAFFLNQQRVEYFHSGPVFHIKASSATPLNEYAKRRKQFDRVRVYIVAYPIQQIPSRTVTLNYDNTFVRHLLGAVQQNGLKQPNYHILKMQEVPKLNDCIHLF